MDSLRLITLMQLLDEKGIVTKKEIEERLQKELKMIYKKEVRKMTEKDIAKKIILMYNEESTDIINLVTDMKDSLNDWLVQLAAHIKSVSGEIKSEDQFLKVMAELTDELLPLPQPFEALDSIFAHYILKGIDKVLLDRVFGADWFNKLQSGVTKLETAKTGNGK